MRPYQYQYTTLKTVSSEWPPGGPARPNTKQYHSQYSLPNSTLSYNEEMLVKKKTQTVSVQRDWNTNTGDTDYRERGRNCKDACVSPIQIIESPRKYPEKRVTIQEERETVTSTYYHRQRVVEDDHETSDEEDEEEEELAADGSPDTVTYRHTTVDDAGTGRAAHHPTDDDDWTSASDSDDGDGDELDGEVIDTQADVQSGLKTAKARLDKERADKSCERQNKILKEIFEKLQPCESDTNENNSSHSKANVYEENERLLEQINEIVDDVLDTQTDVATMMIEKCLTHFDTKDRKLPLDKCIVNMKEEISNLKDKLVKEEKKANEMAEDMWKHQLEMTKLNNLKKQQSQLKTENVQLQGKCRELANSKEEKDKEIKSLTQQIMHMDTLLQDKDSELSEYRKTSDKRVVKRQGTARKVSLATVTRRPGLYPSNEPRLLAAKGTNPCRTPRSSITQMTKLKRP